MGAPVAFFEIISTDHERAQRFYAELFGDAAIGGGIGPASDEDGPRVSIYMRVDDLDGYLGRAEKLGGTPLVPPMDLPSGYGRIAVFADPDGNKVGLWS
jgi:predicted enzyme related to lactoylglutathione lyase